MRFGAEKAMLLLEGSGSSSFSSTLLPAACQGTACSSQSPFSLSVGVLSTSRTRVPALSTRSHPAATSELCPLPLPGSRGDARAQPRCTHSQRQTPRSKARSHLVPAPSGSHRPPSCPTSHTVPHGDNSFRSCRRPAGLRSEAEL